MHIYQGELNWPSRIVDENFTILLPDDIGLGKPVHAYWREIASIDGSTGQSHTVIAEISAVETIEAGTRIQFSHTHDKDYRFDATLTADGKVMSITMCASDDSVSPLSSLRLISSLGLTVGAWADSRVYNNTGNAYYCILADSTNFTYWSNTVLAGIGGYFGIVGFVTAFASLPMAAGIALAGTALVPAVYSFYDSQASRDSPVEDLLGPGSSIYRSGYNDLTITQLSIEGSNLVVKTALKKSLGGGITRLSDIVGSLDWKPFLMLNLGSGGRRIETRSLIMAERFRLGNSGGEEIVDGANLLEKAVGTKLNLPRSPDQKYRLFDSGTALELYPDDTYNYGFVATAGTVQTGTEDGVIDLDKNPIRLVWRMMGFRIYYQGTPTSLGRAGGDTDVKRILADHINHNYVAYSWERPGSQVVRGYRKEQVIRIQSGGPNYRNMRIYIPIKQSLSYQKLA